MRALIASTRRRRAAGFTLIELLVTIGIMVLALSFAVVAFRPIFGAAGLQSGVRIVRATLDGARVRAIQQRRQVRFKAELTPDDPKRGWRVTSSAGDLGQEWKPLPDFVAVSTAEAWSGTDDLISITFGPDGRVVRYVVGTTTSEPVGVLTLYLHNTRDSGQSGGASIDIMTLTGSIEVGGQDD